MLTLGTGGPLGDLVVGRRSCGASVVQTVCGTSRSLSHDLPAILHGVFVVSDREHCRHAEVYVAFSGA